jgi:hypothetical protein
VLRTGAIEVVTSTLIADLASILEDRPGIEVVAKVEKPTVNNLALVLPPFDVAVQIAL